MRNSSSSWDFIRQIDNVKINILLYIAYIVCYVMVMVMVMVMVNVCCYLYEKDKLFFSTQCNSVYAAKLVFLINDYYYLITCMIRYRLDNTNLLIYFVLHDTFLGILVVLGFGFTCTEKTIWNNQFGYF